MYRPRATFLISRSMMPSSGGLTSSSAELIAHSGAVIFSRCGDGLYVVEQSYVYSMSLASVRVARSRRAVTAASDLSCVGLVLCNCIGLLVIIHNAYCAAMRPFMGGLVYSPALYSGSPLMACMIIARNMRLRPAISTGALASGISASIKPGYMYPQIQVCIPPIDVPVTRRRWSTPETFLDQQVLGAHHVLVVVVRKFGLESIARLARPSMADGVGQDDEVLAGVERLPFAEQLAAESRAEERAAASAGSVHDDHRVVDAPGRVTGWLADCGVVQS